MDESLASVNFHKAHDPDVSVFGRAMANVKFEVPFDKERLVDLESFSEDLG